MIKSAIGKNAAMDRAFGANRLGSLQFPWAGSEPIMQVCQRTDGANVNDIARKDVVKFLALSNGDVTMPAPLNLLQLLFADNFVAESDASLAHDAPFSVKGDMWAYGDWFNEVRFCSVKRE